MNTGRLISHASTTIAVGVVAFAIPFGDLRQQTSAAAQATPDAGSAACTVQPRSFDDFLAVAAATPGVLQAPLRGLPVNTPVPPPVDAGRPAEPRIVEAVTATVEELIACINAGDAARLFALYTDEAFSLALGGGGPVNEETRQEIIEFTTPNPLPADLRQPVPRVSDVRVLPDGRVSALASSGSVVSRIVFVESDGRNLIEWSYDLSGTATPTP